MTEALRAHFADYAAFQNCPAFFKNFAHLAVGQLWILAKAVGRA